MAGCVFSISAYIFMAVSIGALLGTLWAQRTLNKQSTQVDAQIDEAARLLSNASELYGRVDDLIGASGSHNRTSQH